MKKDEYGCLSLIIGWVVGAVLLIILFNEVFDWEEATNPALLVWTVAALGQPVWTKLSPAEPKSRSKAARPKPDEGAGDDGEAYAYLRQPFRIEMVYKNADDEQQRRVVDVRAVRFYDSRARRGVAVEYLRGHCHVRKATRTFRADRIQELILPDGEVLSGKNAAERKAITKSLGALLQDMVA